MISWIDKMKQKLFWRFIYATVTYLSCVVSTGLILQSGAGKSTACHNGMSELNYTLPMFFECGKKQHPNGSWVQSIPKLIPALSADNRCCRAKRKFGIPQGHRTCSFPDCDKKPCENGWCEETIQSYKCHCAVGFQGERCNERLPVTTNEIETLTNSMIVKSGTTHSTATTAAARPRDCSEIQTGGVTLSGVYPIYPDGDGDPFFVYCDMETDGGEWTIFQRRQDGSVDFFLYWSDYKHGFGSVSAEHWLGNDKIHRLTTQKTYELRVDLEDFEGHARNATYSEIRVADETANYTMTLGDYSGNAGDSLTFQAGHPFSTRDRDNDNSTLDRENCAERYKGGWWYSACHESNLNGLYLNGTMSEDENAKGIVWLHWLGHRYSLKKTEMKIRPLAG